MRMFQPRVFVRDRESVGENKESRANIEVHATDFTAILPADLEDSKNFFDPVIDVEAPPVHKFGAKTLWDPMVISFASCKLDSADLPDLPLSRAFVNLPMAERGDRIVELE